METKTIICPTILADVLVSLGVAKLPEAPKAPEAPKQPEPVKPLWQQFVAAVKASDMTDAMKVACVAQAINESGRGTSRVAKECNNFWGIKMRSELDGLAVGRRVEVTSEVEGFAVFAQFPDVATGIKGWLKFLTRSYYKGWEAYKDDAAGFIRHIGTSWTPKKTYADEVIRGFGEAEILLGIKLEKTDKEPTNGKKRILSDAGHSLAHPGARSKNGQVKEELLNKIQSKILKQTAEEAGLICDEFDPEDDNKVEIGRKAKGYDAFISWHGNAFDGTGQPGTEVFITTFASAEQEAVAKKVCDAICKELGTTNRGVKRKNWTVINEADKLIDGPVMLIESFFITNISDNTVAEDWAKRAANVASKVIVEHLKP
jgi:N-acetylmuramoyl-L-alanine amidase